MAVREEQKGYRKDNGMRYQDDRYEDELDRMRDRHDRKKNGGTVSSGRRPSHAQQARSSASARSSALGNHRRITRTGRKRRMMMILVIAALFAGAFFMRKTRDDGYWTIAVYGLDSRDGRTGKGALADVQMIAGINKKTGEIRLASVFRDTYLQINSDGDFNKINEAYFLGGYEQAVTAFEDNFDLKIDDCATFNWKAVADAINVLGGIDLEITDQEFAYINSFITETVESTGVGSVHLEHSGMNHLDGVQAVAYARLRLMDTDFKRTERQRKVIGLAMEKAKQADFKTLKSLIATVYPEIFTTIRVDDILWLVKNAKKYYIGQTSGFPFAHTEMKISKKSCVVPTTLESNVVQLHAFLYDDMDYQPSDQVRYISARIGEISGLTEPGKDIESGKNIGAQDHVGGGQSAPAADSLKKETEAVSETADHETFETSAEMHETAVEDSEGVDSEESNLEESIDETLEDTNPENMEQGPGVSRPNVIPGPESIFDAIFGREETGIQPGEEPGTSGDGDDSHGPGVEPEETGRGDGTPTIHAGSSHGNALEAPPGETKPPSETAQTGVRPGA